MSSDYGKMKFEASKSTRGTSGNTNQWWSAHLPGKALHLIPSPIEKKKAGEMAQWLRALTVLPEDPSSIPSTHMAAYNCL